MGPETWPQPSRLRSWIDSDGTIWRRVGEEPLSVKGARRAFADSGKTVVRFYGLVPEIITDAADRAHLWSRIEPIIRGHDSNPFASVKVFRYRDGAGASMIAVEESC